VNGLTLADGLICPISHRNLSLVSLQNARNRICSGAPLAPRIETPGVPVVGETDWVLIRDDDAAAFPIVSGIPILLAPEMLGDSRSRRYFDLKAPQYAESYLEMEFYNSTGFKEAERLRRTDSLIAGDAGEGLQHLERLRRRAATERESFPEPADIWLHSRMDLQSEWDSFVHIGPVKGQRLLQLGGSGTAIQTLLLAGASEALLLTPMIGEAQAATASAEILGVADRFKCLVAVAEEIPLADESVDVAFSSGCVHHMRTEIAFPEIARVLRQGGRFAAVEPWRAPFYGIGTKLLGKREANAFCRPITGARVAPLFDAFRSARYELHGTLSRYPMLGLQKFGIITPMHRAWHIGRMDDHVCSWLGLRRFGSGVALLATK
jgi:SAM-dependent methyltransferase/uncharacterized protein YbaR (Trm112 family)